MTNYVKRTVTVVLVAAVTAGCVTVNELDAYRIEGRAIATELRQPPPPEFETTGTVDLSSENPYRVAFSIATAVIREAGRIEAETRLTDAAMQIPPLVAERASAGIIDVLGARAVDRRGAADYELWIDIPRYGIESSGGSGITLFLTLEAELVDAASGSIVWRRRVRESERAVPSMFGLSPNVDNIVSATVLANLSEEALVRGFERLSVDIARKITDRLVNDLRER